MRVIDRPHSAVARPHVRDLRGGQPAYQAYSILYAGFVLLPIIAGADKFTHILVNWNQYLSPAFASAAGGRVDLMMRGVGIVEIVAGLLVAARPRIGASVVAAWLAGIILNLLLLPGYFDVALRDFGLMLGALALQRLSSSYAMDASSRPNSE